MSDTVKLIIEISKTPKNDHERWVLVHGTPLDRNSERAEVQAYFDGEAYGWEEGRKALIDDVKAEIEKKCDRINSIASVLRYPQHREIQELLCEILASIDKGDEEGGAE